MSNEKCPLVPLRYSVIVLPDKVEEMAGESSVIVRPEQNIEVEQRAQVRGTLVAIAGMAFDDWKGQKPEVGDRIYFSKYAGIYTDAKGPNGVVYRVMQDEHVMALLSE